MRPILFLALATSLPAAARTFTVHPGESIRAALAQASPGDRIQVMPGVYREGAPGDLNALTVTLDGISLIGKSRPGHPVVLENAGNQSYGVWVSPANSTGDAEADDEHPPCGLDGTTLFGFTIQGFTVRGFLQHGVHLACVDGFSISENHADGNQVYGLFPVVSKHGEISGNLVTNTPKDAGIYVGQSDEVVVSGNVSRDNVLAIEIENSRKCAVVGNEVHGNTMGIFVDILPFLERNTQEDTLVAFNSVHDNNRPNTANPEDLLGVVPSGTGMLIAGGHRTTVMLNDVRNNGFTGISVISLCLGLELLGGDCSGLDIDPNPVDDRIVLNKVIGNGTVSQDNPFFDALRADLIWDGSGTGNCWSANLFRTSTPAQLPSCH